jgi:hypothetical protein
MTKVDLTLNLPDELAARAEAAGLLSSRELARLLRAEIKRQAAAELVAGANRAAAASSKPMSMREIQDEVDAVRKANNEAEAQAEKMRRLLERLSKLPRRHSGDWRREDLYE